jgi:hypothetical protein
VVIAFCAIRFQSVTALPIAAGDAALGSQAGASVALADAPDVASTVAAAAATATASATALAHLRKRDDAFMLSPPWQSATVDLILRHRGDRHDRKEAGNGAGSSRART